MGSSHAIGRTLLASGLLGGSSMSAEEIIAHLATALTDVELCAKMKSQGSDAVWAKAYGVQPEPIDHATWSTKTRSAEAVWDRVNAKFENRRSAAQ